MTRKVVMRRCVVSNEMIPKNDLIRITKNKEGIVSVDPTGKAHGRGAYIKKDIATLEKAIQTRALARALQTDIPEEIYDQIREILK